MTPRANKQSLEQSLSCPQVFPLLFWNIPFLLPLLLCFAPLISTCPTLMCCTCVFYPSVASVSCRPCPSHLPFCVDCLCFTVSLVSPCFFVFFFVFCVELSCFPLNVVIFEFVLDLGLLTFYCSWYFVLFLLLDFGHPFCVSPCLMNTFLLPVTPCVYLGPHSPKASLCIILASYQHTVLHV